MGGVVAGLFGAPEPEPEPEREPTLAEASTAFITAKDLATAAQEKAKEIFSDHGVESAEDLDEAGAILTKVAHARKEIDRLRKESTKPHRDEVASINESFGELASPLAGIEEALKAQVVAFQRAEEERVEAERRRLEANAKRRQTREDKRAEEQGREAAQHEAPEIPDAPASRDVIGGQVQTRKVWKMEVVDEDAVPREYLMVDEPLIRKAVKDGVREIPGVRIFEDRIAAVRT